MITKESIRQALERGYCTKANKNKEVDVDLVSDMANEIIGLILSNPPKLKDDLLQTPTPTLQPLDPNKFNFDTPKNLAEKDFINPLNESGTNKLEDIWTQNHGE